MFPRLVRTLVVGSMLGWLTGSIAGCSDNESGPVVAVTPAGTTTPPTTAAPPRPVAGCPSGTWMASQEELQNYFNTVGSMSAVSIIVTGGAELRLGTDGRMSFVVGDFRFAQDAGGTRIDLLLDGSIDGTYAVDGSVLTTEALLADAAATASIDGTEMEVDPVLQSFIDQLPFDQARYRCTGDELVLDVTVSGTPHVITLVAARS
jgi:hypothetical protein